MAKRTLGTHFLKQWREYRGLSLRKLAKVMEIEPGVELTSHANIGRIENHQQPYSQEILEAAAEQLHCTVVEILTVDPTAAGYSEHSDEAGLRSAMLAYGVDRNLLDAAMLAVQGFRTDSEDASRPQQPRVPVRTGRANRRREPAPSK